MTSNLHNPYGNGPGAWLRGNLHAHTVMSDGIRTPQELVDAYAARGYDFLMISDHDVLVDVDGLDPRGMVLIPGCEVTARGPHVLHVDAPERVRPAKDRRRVINAINKTGGFAVINHPNWETSYNHCPQRYLESWSGYVGIEIYNAVVLRQAGHPQATDRWDRLLSQGRRVWGFANDDAHFPEDEGRAWNVVWTESRDRASIVDALREGRFYASTGVTLRSVSVEGTRICVETEDAELIVAHADFGRREASVEARTLEIDVAGCAARYLRFECWGRGDRMAWTQPFFLR